MPADNNISRELQSRVEGLAENNTSSAEILATNKRNAELFVLLHQAMVEQRWEEAVALVRQAPESLLCEATLAHAESAPLLESVFSSAPGTYQQLAGSTSRVAQVLSEAGSVLAAVELGRRPLREEDVQSLARVAGEKDLQVRLVGAAESWAISEIRFNIFVLIAFALFIISIFTG